MSKLSTSVESLLQDQYRHEMSNHFRYMQRASWAEKYGMSATGRLFRQEAKGELDHAKRVYKFLNDRGVIAQIAPFSFDEPIEWDYISLFQTAMEVELDTTEKLKAIKEAALADGDYQTADWLIWLITEQTEEENLYQTILDRIATRMTLAKPGTKYDDLGNVYDDIDKWIGKELVK